MERAYLISCESTADLPLPLMQELGVPCLFHERAGEERRFDMASGRETRAGDGGAFFPLRLEQYLEFFEKLSGDYDLIHICPSAALSPSFHVAQNAADILRQEAPGTSIQVVDSRAVSVGYGMLVWEAAGLRGSVPTPETAAGILRELRGQLRHLGFTPQVSELVRNRFLDRPRRIDAWLEPFALLRLNEAGELVSFARSRTEEEAVDHMIFAMADSCLTARGRPEGCWIAHADNAAGAQRLARAVEECFPQWRGMLRVFAMGQTGQSLCGEGLVTVSFRAEAEPGDRRIK